PEFPSKSVSTDSAIKIGSSLDALGRSRVLLDRVFDEDEAELVAADLRRVQGANLAALLAGGATADGAQPDPDGPEALKAKFDALGVAIRAGVDPADAAGRLGLTGIKFTGAVPVSLRMPNEDASGL